MDYFDGPRRNRRRDVALAGGVFLLALLLFFMPAAYQGTVRETVRETALRPFITVQGRLASLRDRNMDVLLVRAERDSLAALVAAQATLAEENSRMRQLLGLRDRAMPEFVAAEVIRVGLPGAGSTFLLDVGTDQGVEAGSPVLAAGGLLGIVREAGRRTSQAIDWTHPDFRASAMTADAEAYGIVEARRGRFREEDLLSLTGAPFHTDIRPGTRIVTSGRGGLYRRGIPLGSVIGIEEADTGWRKSYLLRPAVRPEAVVHVLVEVRRERSGDLSRLWLSSPDEPDAREPDTP